MGGSAPALASPHGHISLFQSLQQEEFSDSWSSALASLTTDPSLSSPVSGSRLAGGTWPRSTRYLLCCPPPRPHSLSQAGSCMCPLPPAVCWSFASSAVHSGVQRSFVLPSHHPSPPLGGGLIPQHQRPQESVPHFCKDLGTPQPWASAAEADGLCPVEKMVPGFSKASTRLRGRC